MTPIERCLAERRPALPWVGAYAAGLEGESVGAFRTDAGARARSLSTAADLFGLPAVATTLDPTVAAEAAGCTVDPAAGTVAGVVETVEEALDVDVDAVAERGRVPAVLDATERLVATLDGTSVLGGVPGPAWLADALLARPDVEPEVAEEVAFVAEDVAIALANAALDRGADGVVVLEPDGPDDPDAFREAAVPLLNVVDHFEATAVLVGRAVDPGAVALAGDLGFDAVTGRVADPADALVAAEDAGVVLGVGVPGERLRVGPDAVDAFVADLPEGALLSTEWAVPVGAAADAVHRLAGTG